MGLNHDHVLDYRRDATAGDSDALRAAVYMPKTLQKITARWDVADCIHRHALLPGECPGQAANEHESWREGGEVGGSVG